MIMAEKRKHEIGKGEFPAVKATSLPKDYLKLVGEIFAENFKPNLEALGKIVSPPRVRVHGNLYPDEIVLSVSIIFEKQMAGLTLHASTDFDPKATSPKAEDLLAVCMDTLGDAFATLFDAGDVTALKALVLEKSDENHPLPIQWSEVENGKRRLYIKFDRSNPELEQMAEDWLNANDPERGTGGSLTEWDDDDSDGGSKIH